MELSHVWQASSTPNCPQGEKCFLIYSLKLPCSNLWAWPLIVLPSTCDSSFLFISLLTLEVTLLLGCLQSLFSKFEQSRFLDLSLQVMYSCPPPKLSGLSTHAPFKFIKQGFQNCRVFIRLSFMTAEERWIMSALNLLAVILLVQINMLVGFFAVRAHHSSSYCQPRPFKPCSSSASQSPACTPCRGLVHSRYKILPFFMLRLKKFLLALSLILSRAVWRSALPWRILTEPSNLLSSANLLRMNCFLQHISNKHHTMFIKSLFYLCCN